jgi:protein gp37
MAEDTKIQWTDNTFNPWMGCTRISQGCEYCYAEVATPSRTMGIKWGYGQKRFRTKTWNQPVKWNKTSTKKKPTRVFCASLADWLDDEVDVRWLKDLLELIYATPKLEWQLLTKRPHLWRSRLEAVIGEYFEPMLDPVAIWIQEWLDGEKAPDNIWFGISIENQRFADKRMFQMLNIPAKQYFLSVEPMLGPIILAQSLEGWTEASKKAFDTKRLWVICGGESGPNARPFSNDWAIAIKKECEKWKAPFFMKQLGGVTDKRGELEDFPEELKVRQFP